MPQNSKRKSLYFWVAFVLIGLELLSHKSAIAKEILLKVGIVQRLGENKEGLTLSSTSGDLLSLSFKDEQGKAKTLQTSQVKLEIISQPLSKGKVEERLVLSDHATFETAENSAKQWRKQGIQVEITQPGRWQVWAKRDVYQTPLLRRWLLESLKKKGATTAYLDTNVVSSQPQVSFFINGVRYYPKQLEITTRQNLVKVTQDNQQPRLYSGSLVIQPNAYSTYTLVNNVPLETYLRGVVPHEIGPNAPLNSAKAQTIIARTYALRNLRRFQADNYELCADTHCQVYYGLTGTNSIADQAIVTTKGLVLTYQNELVDALYSSTTGGVTALFSDVWDGEERPYLQALVDSPLQVWNLTQQSLANEETFRRFINLKDGFNETGRTVFRWSKESTIQELNQDLKKYLERRKDPLANFKTIIWMEVTKRSPSGRILTMAIQTDKGMLELYKNEVRSAFSPPRSTLFYIEPIYDANNKIKGYSFVGGGLGHGVGLSQYGSYNLAKLGWTAEKILAFYYPGTKIQPLNTSIIYWKEKK
ncbi:SpoIID/LytB domain-containing protein [Chroococcus sp. FPU101]|uniref:SpoIID/LytB domain-containing protein n=1 Tax=Chroococcus sp. FPU101 TaxID=1974212 RepID=UPI001A8D142A|nr:SpoIID/LytB domain-containing protein [Chroococcus sp. FPU101]GFE67394.1 amidase enhancer [Chroococcus sp. FPU101]